MIPLSGDPLNGRARCRKATWRPHGVANSPGIFRKTPTSIGRAISQLSGSKGLRRPPSPAGPAARCLSGAGCAFLAFKHFDCRRPVFAQEVASSEPFPARGSPLSRTASRSSHPSAGRPRFARRSPRFPLRPPRRSARRRRTAADESFDDHEFDADAQPLPEDEIDEALDDEPDVEHTGEDDQIDDPVRIYLMQMGEIPMLSRREEKAVARRIVRSRRRFRCCMLATDYILHAAMGLLESVRDNKLRLDRTMEVSVVNVGEKSRLLKVLTPNLRTLQPSAAAKQARFRPGHCPAATGEMPPRGLAAAVEPPREGGPAGGGNGTPHATLAAVAEEAPAVGRAGGRDPPTIGGAVPRRGRSRPPRRTPQGTVPPDADYAREPGHVAPPAGAGGRAGERV